MSKLESGAEIHQRVFGIGMNKTGTTSLKRCFGALDLYPIAPNALESAEMKEAVRGLFEQGDYEPILKLAANYRSFEDRPWNVWEMYQRLDERFPDSRFILTVREPESWWRSTGRWITVVKPRMAKKYLRHLGAASLAKADMIAAYEQYNEGVIEHFAGTDKLLVIDFEKGQGWPELCGFLGLPVPEAAFPHVNRQSYDERDLERRRRDRQRSVESFLRYSRFARRSANREPEFPCGGCGHPVLWRDTEYNPMASATPDWVRKVLLQGHRWQLRRDEAKRAPIETRVAAIRDRGVRIDDMAVVCCYFNPCGYRARLENFRRFHEGICKAPVPLLTVELAFGDEPHQLGDEFGEVLRLRTPDVMWQKERLINLGIQALLDRGVEKIAWLDADIAFDEPGLWPWLVADELDRSALCQVFSHVRIEEAKGAGRAGISALKYFEDEGELLRQTASLPSRTRPVGQPIGLSGYGWAARAEVLRETKLYDSAVVGGGDKLVLAGSLGMSDQWRRDVVGLTRSPLRRCTHCGYRGMSRDYTNHFRAWGRSWDAAVRGRVGFVDQSIRTFYHGEATRRLYVARRDILLRHEYSPATDLALSPDGTWRWASDKSALHQEVRSYFAERKEDD
ncbi:MAG: hypothetical protein JRH10_06890 [Deltaproteobacteria bacterium]|nr:hypothetical protein [Deltaproteobacteria bacterium]